MSEHRINRYSPVDIRALLIVSMIMLVSLGCEREQRESSYTVPVAEIEKKYGRLVTVANFPTISQHGTGDHLGFFEDANGTFWGIPLARGNNGEVIACDPAKLVDAPISDYLPSDTVEIVGAANEPTNWRGGTGNLELMLRNSEGKTRWYPVNDIETTQEAVCWSQSDPVIPLPFYRLVIKDKGK